MKRNAYLLLILLVAATFTACKKDKIEYNGDYEKSLKAWTAFKASSNNSYIYVVTGASVFGLSGETTITIQNGKPVGRSFVLKDYAHDGTNNKVVIEEWHETAANISSHDRAPEALTLDEVYKIVKDDYLRKRPNVKTYFEANNNGLISSAGYVENGCNDDCFMGISISSVKEYASFNSNP